jgi:hypothetical protein
MQFVNFTQIMSRPIPTSKTEAEFALSALMEIPEQFKAAMSLQLLGYFLVCIFAATSISRHSDPLFSFLIAAVHLKMFCIWFLWAGNEEDFPTGQCCLHL